MFVQLLQKRINDIIKTAYGKLTLLSNETKQQLLSNVLKEILSNTTSVLADRLITDASSLQNYVPLVC